MAVGWHIEKFGGAFAPRQSLGPIRRMNAVGPSIFEVNHSNNERQISVAQGIVKKFLDERGFGFIRPDDGGPDIFFHIRSFSKPEGEPAAGDRVEYEIDTDPPTGRPRAQNVRLT
jgi:cold shock protein